MIENDITVITLTRNRPKTLPYAIKSVMQQNCLASIIHLILIDDCITTQELLIKKNDLPANVTWRWMPRTSLDRSGPGRSARLRNFGVHLANSTWVAFLDDDNQWEKDHLRYLLQCTRDTEVNAAHSHRKLFYRDGTPYLEERMPWHRNAEIGRRRYRELCKKGVVSPGSCIMRDRADPIDHPNPVHAVDTSSWLLARKLLIEVPFRDNFTPADEVSVIGEDDKLLADLIAKREKITCSNEPTLLYYLGGYSNNFDEPFDASFVWR